MEARPSAERRKMGSGYVQGRTQGHRPTKVGRGGPKGDGEAQTGVSRGPTRGRKRKIQDFRRKIGRNTPCTSKGEEGGGFLEFQMSAER